MPKPSVVAFGMRWVILLLFCLPLAAASAQSVGLTVRAGVSGPGIDISTKISDRLQIRVSAAYLSVNSERQVVRGGIPYNIDGGLAAGSAGVLLDLLVSRHLRLSAGLSTFISGGSVSISPLSEGRIAGSMLSVSELGSVSLTSAFPEQPAPYLGLGIGNVLGRSRFSVLADVGITYAGSPSFMAKSDGRLSASNGWAPVLEAAFSGLRWVPMASVGMAIRIDGPRHK